jgi:hypothetical protein
MNLLILNTKRRRSTLYFYLSRYHKSGTAYLQDVCLGRFEECGPTGGLLSEGTMWTRKTSNPAVFTVLDLV